jgi:SPP1 family predicted phage head-tail adaptor
MARAGMLDRRITIQVKSVVTNSYNEEIITWSTHKSVWANPVQEMGKEQTTDNNRSTERKVNFRVRWHPSLTNEMRVIWESNYYKIEDIKELGRKDGMIIQTTLLAQT